MSHENYVLECDRGTCKAPAGHRDITSCIYCGGELREISGAWYHWTQFYNGGGELIPGSKPQDYVNSFVWEVSEETYKALTAFPVEYNFQLAEDGKLISEKQ